MGKLVTEDIRRKLRRISPTIEMLSGYSHSQLPLTCRCLICKNIWSPTWSNLSQGSGCPKCSLISSNLTDCEVRKRLKRIAPTIVLMEKYSGAMVLTKCRCLSCGHMWKTKWASLNGGRGCPVCGRERIGQKLRFTTKEVKLFLRKISPSISVLGEYRDSASPLLCSCRVCHHKWYPVWTSLSRGVGCPKCSKVSASAKTRYSIVDVKRILRKISPGILVLSKQYVNCYSLLECKCGQCSSIWKSSWTNLQQGHGCPNCTCKSESEVRTIFERLTGLKFPRANPSDVPWLHGLYLDGYCEELKDVKHPNGVAFEYQGVQHYREHWSGETKEGLSLRKRRDARKKMQCWRNGVKLIRVPYNIKDLEAFIQKRVCKQKKMKKGRKG